MKTISSLLLSLLLSFALPLQAADAPPAETDTSRDEGMDAQTLYEFLVGEIAGQRGDLALSGEAYVDLAKRTRDPRVARRAAEIALYGQNLDKALEMARLWLELEPDSAQARRLLASALVATGRLDEAEPVMLALLQAKDAVPAETFRQFQGLLERSRDKPAALKLLQTLAAGYPDLPEAHQVVAQAAIDAGQNALALTELDAMLRLDPASELGALLKGEALSEQGDAAVLSYWKSFLAAHPEAARVRVAYAKGLTRASRFEEARQQFEILAQGAPESPETRLAIGLLDMQMNDLDGAEAAFRKALDLGYQDDGLVKMYLGQVAEARRQYDQALAWYDQVGGGGFVLQAGLKAAVAQGKLGQVDEALARLDKLAAQRPADATLIVQARVQVLREAGRYQAAYDLLSRALEKTPDSADLLYDRSMIGEKLDRLQDMEADLRRLIKLQPNSAQAYNALGYTLVDRTTRIDEGIALLDKALKLSPDDPFILDSMGWGQFKAGHLDQAEAYLRRAYQDKPDPEIAAHLGEVLWQKGSRDEAGQLWREALKDHPDNDLLRQTMARFGQ